MSLIIEFIAGSWSTLLPLLVAASGFLFGAYHKAESTKAKANQALSDSKANAEEKRAMLAEDIRDAVIEKSKQSKQAVNDAVEKAKTDRTHFSG